VERKIKSVTAEVAEKYILFLAVERTARERGSTIRTNDEF